MGKEKDGGGGGVDAQRLSQKDGGQKNEVERMGRPWGFGYFSASIFLPNPRLGRGCGFGLRDLRVSSMLSV